MLLLYLFKFYIQILFFFYYLVHFYTYSGAEWDPSIYPRARFVSEYGFQSYPSFETLEKVSNQSDWVYPFNDFMKKRQHHMFGKYFYILFIDR